MKLRIIRSEREMTFPKAYEIPHQSFPSKICIYMQQKPGSKGGKSTFNSICPVSKI